MKLPKESLSAVVAPTMESIECMVLAITKLSGVHDYLMIMAYDEHYQ